MTHTHKTINLAHISSEMMLFELIDAHPALLSIFSRLNIILPFGDISIEEMCQRDGRSTELFMMLCSMHLDPRYRPSHDNLKEEMIGEVVDYLRASHRYYSGYMLPHASRHLEEILEHCDNLSRNALRGFYADYVSYIERHFEEEEVNIFQALERAETATDKAFAIFGEPHSDIDDRTNDIASLVFKSLPESAPTALRAAMLKDIYALRDDLRRHSNVESYLLRPLVDKFIITPRR